MSYKWFSEIDNIASFRDGTLLFDIERHSARGISKSGRIVRSAPKYAFMIDHCGATEKGFFSRRPLSTLPFLSAVRKLGGYLPEKISPTVVRYSHPERNHFVSLEKSVSFGTDMAGSMVGLIQKELVDSLDELLKKTLPSAIEDWNVLAKHLNLRPINNILLSKLSKQAREKNRQYPKTKTLFPWPKEACRFWFEQE